MNALHGPVLSAWVSLGESDQRHPRQRIETHHGDAGLTRPILQCGSVDSREVASVSVVSLRPRRPARQGYRRRGTARGAV